MRKIPVCDIAAQTSENYQILQEVFNRVLQSGYYLMGPELKAFEEAFAKYLGLSHCVGVGSGTAAVALALRSVGVKEGDEVITVSHTAVATVAAIEIIGGVPVLADIDPVSRCISPSSIRRLITPKTKAIVPVHIYGHPADMFAISEIAKEFDLKVVEDCAQAAGALIGGDLVGTFSDAAAFSFYPTKNLGCCGDGGAVVTDLKSVADEVSALRQYGWRTRFISSEKGFNSRLSEIQAAVLSVKLPLLKEWNARRARIAARYAGVVNKKIVHPQVLKGYTHAWHLYVVETEARDELKEYLAESGIQSGLHYPQAVHKQPAYVDRLRTDGDLPQTEALYQKILTLPMYPELSEEDVTYICQKLQAW